MKAWMGREEEEHEKRVSGFLPFKTFLKPVETIKPNYLLNT